MSEKRFQWIYIKDNTLELRDNGIVKVFNNERLEELLNDLADENEQLKKLFFEMLIQTNVEIDPKKPTRYSATLIFNAEQYLTVEKIKKDFKR